MCAKKEMDICKRDIPVKWSKRIPFMAAPSIERKLSV
jgi:hypothetical protein